MNGLAILLLIAIPVWILAGYFGRVILLKRQHRMGVFLHCPHCGKRYDDDP